MYIGDKEIYVKAFNGKFVKITWLFDDTDNANHFMSLNHGMSVIEQTKGFIFLAPTEDLGMKV